MEQHNIDKRFKNSLGEISRQPSPDAWARLQAQMEPLQVQEEKKNRGFWLYIAAAITLLLASVATWQFTAIPTPDRPQLAAKEMPAPTPAPSKAEPAPAQVKEALPETMLAQNATKNNSKTEKATPAPETLGAKSFAANKIRSNRAREVVPVIKEADLASDRGTMVAGTKPETKKGKLSKEPAEGLKINPSIGFGPDKNVLLASGQAAKTPQPTEEIFDLNGKPVIVIVKKAIPAPELLAANTPAEAQEQRDPVKLKDIFKQARNLKKGEGVNLQDLGLTASSRLAVETHSIQEKFTKILDL